MSKKKQHKVTTEVYKRIKEISAELKPCQIYKNGKPQFRTLPKRCTWDELQQSSRDHMEKNQKKLNKKGMFTEMWKECLMVNHEVCLIEEYKMHGEDGINFYVEMIAKALEAPVKNEDSNTNS